MSAYRAGTIACSAFGLWLCVSTSARTAEAPPLANQRSSTTSAEDALDSLLARAGVYVSTFDTLFSNVVAEERYVQEATQSRIITMASRVGPVGAGSSASTQRRELVSDFLLVKLAGEEEWLPFRDVFEVDKKPVRDREDRLTALFIKPQSTAIAQAVAIMTESARYNIGTVQRTVNLPVLALMVLRPSFQYRFRFSKTKLDADAGPNVYTVDYREQVGPTIVQGPSGRDLYSHGRFWIEAPTGRVVKSEMVTQDASVKATVTTRYQLDAGFTVAVPVEMREEYSLPNGTRITGHATYGHFRRFGVQVDENIEQPPTF